MRTSSFEYRHQLLLHMLLVGLASLTYAIDPLNVVWALVRGHGNSRTWERLIFGLGAYMLFASAALETWANARDQASIAERGPNGATHSHKLQTLLARILLVLTIALLLPLPGTVLLITGEAILVFRLFREDERTVGAPVAASGSQVSWRSGFRAAASRWGFTATMIAFVWTLQDRVAEIGAACSAVLWLVLNFRSLNVRWLNVRGGSQ